LPPLLYSAAWYTSWHEFWRMRRPISLLAFGLVLLTATAVAYAAHYLIPDFPLALGFLMGGIVSPPDAVAATSVLENLKVPKRIVTILEGESLVNDASSLIIFRFALAALFTGKFIAWKAGLDFLLVVFMGILTGLVIAHIVYAIHRWLPTTATIDTAITLISPYLMYITAEHFHYSGVLAVVTGGLFLSFRSHDVFNYSSRLQSVSVWNVIVFLLNGATAVEQKDPADGDPARNEAGLHHRLERDARCRLPGIGTGHTHHARQRRIFPSPQYDPLHYFHRHPRHPGVPGTDAPADHPVVRR
jgi:CPA1 family monovalent cation:H+ antiporter